jgi:hypothetical protein
MEKGNRKSKIVNGKWKRIMEIIMEMNKWKWKMEMNYENNNENGNGLKIEMIKCGNGVEDWKNVLSMESSEEGE